MIREATEDDWPAIWAILEPIFRAGETYAVDRDITQFAARRMWMDHAKATFVVEEGEEILATYYIKANFGGGAAHVCNCGYATHDTARGRGLATAMCEHSLTAAKDLGFTAMQYNSVVATNEGAIRLWQKLGFETVGTLPGAFDHPTAGKVDAFVMWKDL